MDDEPILGWTAYSIELNEVRELSSRIKEKKTAVETASSLPRRLLSSSDSTQPALPLGNAITILMIILVIDEFKNASFKSLLLLTYLLFNKYRNIDESGGCCF